jgi:hypothetical protein
MIEPHVRWLRWERSMFASRLGIWEEAAFATIGKHIPLWSLKRFCPVELSGLATFAGSTVISLVSYAPGMSVGKNQTDISDFTETLLVVLNIIILVHSYSIVRKSLYDFKKYLRMEGW